jgi:hypothetical protein
MKTVTRTGFALVVLLTPTLALAAGAPLVHGGALDPLSVGLALGLGVTALAARRARK